MRGNEKQYFVLEEIRLPVKQQQTYTINIHDDWIKNKSIKKTMEAVVLKMHLCRVIPYINRKSYAASTQKEELQKATSTEPVSCDVLKCSA